MYFHTSVVGHFLIFLSSQGKNYINLYDIPWGWEIVFYVLSLKHFIWFSQERTWITSKLIFLRYIRFLSFPSKRMNDKSLFGRWAIHLKYWSEIYFRLFCRIFITVGCFSCHIFLGVKTIFLKFKENYTFHYFIFLDRVLQKLCNKLCERKSSPISS